MNIFVPIFCLISLTLAEPPVGDGYPASRSHDHHHNDVHDDHDSHTSERQTISEEYGPPAFTSRNAISNEYPSTRNFQSTGQNTPSKTRVNSNHRFNSTTRNSQDYSTPAMQGYDFQIARSENSQASHASNSNAQGYESRNAHDNSGGYETPASRSLSQEYGPPDVSARTLSTEYGMPDVRSTPSQEYGVPIAARSNQRSHSASNLRTQSEKSLPRGFSAATRSQSATNPRSRSSDTSSRSSNGIHGYDTPKSFAKTAFGSKTTSQTHEAPGSDSPSSAFDRTSARTSESHRTPSARTSSSHSQGYSYNSGSQSTSAGARSQDFKMHSSRINGKSNDMSSHLPTSSRSAPSSSYLPASPTSLNEMPSQEYGVPEQDNRGSDAAKARALEELLNQEPANYDFSYQIEDQESGSDFGHTETRHGNSAHGSYFVVLPDGTKQTVEYEADERGFKPRIFMEPAARGYDENSQDIAARSAEGPY